MSDLKLYNLNSKKLIKPKQLQSLEMQDLIESFSDDLLEVTMITTNYRISRGTEIIPSLGYDGNYNLVIIEYRNNRFGKIINKGLVLVDYIKENISEFKLLIGKAINNDVAKLINYNPRLIIIGNDFVKYDEYAIKQMNGQIDLIKLQGYGNNHILLEKIYQSKNIDHSQLKYKFTNNNQEKLYHLINEFLLSLGDEVIEVGFQNYFYYRKIKTFLYLLFNETIECRVLVNGEYKSYQINNEKDFEKIKSKIENSYEQN